MNIHFELSKRLQSYRKKKNVSITQVAKSIGVDRTYLSKLENGHERPSVEVLNNLASHYQLSKVEANELFLYAGYRTGIVLVHTQGKEESMDKNDKDKKEKPEQQSPPNINVKLNDNLPVLYSDSVWVTANAYGVLLDFAVNLGPTNQQNVVSRIGMSKDHARALAGAIIKQIEGPNLKIPENTLKN